MKHSWHLRIGFGLVFTLVFISCQFQPAFIDEESGSTNSTSRREYLAVLKARNNHTLEVGELEKLVNNFLNPVSEKRSLGIDQQTIITGASKLTAIGERRFSVNNQSRSAGGKETKEVVEVYAFTTKTPQNEKPGYVIASNDIRLGNLLAVVDEGSLYNEETAWFTDIVYKGIEGYIDRTIAEYETISKEEVVNALKKATMETTRTVYETPEGYEAENWNHGYGGLYQNGNTTLKEIVSIHYSWYNGYYAPIPVAWDQKAPYNYVVNKARNGTATDFYYTGCGPTALAQLMAFHERPLSCKLNQTVPNLNVNFNGRPYNWSAMKSEVFPSYFAEGYVPSNNVMDIAVLMYEIGKRAGSTYTQKTSGSNKGGTSTSRGGLKNALTQMGYTTPDSWMSYDFYTIESSIQANKPVIMEGWTDQNNLLGIKWEGGSGHFWLIDGIRKMTYTECFADGTYYSPRGADGPGHGGDLSWVRCNLGWSGDSNAWYISGIFDCREEHQSLARANKANHYYQYFLKILPNITWNGN